jgi:hypothetical protein
MAEEFDSPLLRDLREKKARLLVSIQDAESKASAQEEIKLRLATLDSKRAALKLEVKVTFDVHTKARREYDSVRPHVARYRGKESAEIQAAKHAQAVRKEYEALSAENRATLDALENDMQLKAAVLKSIQDQLATVEAEYVRLYATSLEGLRVELQNLEGLIVAEIHLVRDNGAAIKNSSLRAAEDGLKTLVRAAEEKKRKTADAIAREEQKLLAEVEGLEQRAKALKTTNDEKFTKSIEGTSLESDRPLAFLKDDIAKAGDSWVILPQGNLKSSQILSNLRTVAMKMKFNLKDMVEKDWEYADASSVFLYSASEKKAIKLKRTDDLWDDLWDYQYYYTTAPHSVVKSIFDSIDGRPIGEMDTVGVNTLVKTTGS